MSSANTNRAISKRASRRQGKSKQASTTLSNTNHDELSSFNSSGGGVACKTSMQVDPQKLGEELAPEAVACVAEVTPTGSSQDAKIAEAAMATINTMASGAQWQNNAWWNSWWDKWDESDKWEESEPATKWSKTES